MVTFRCNKLGRDKGLEGFKSEGITLHYRIVVGKELQAALLLKIKEESEEACSAHGRQELIAELADVLEVIDGLCKAHDIALQEVLQIKQQKCQERGGFEKGLFIDTIQMDDDNPKVAYFRASPQKYQEL